MSVLLGIGDTVQATVLDGSLLAALALAVLAGLVSFASPCVLPLVPGYLGYLGGMAGAGRVSTAGSTPADDGAPAHPADDGAPTLADDGAPVAQASPRTTARPAPGAPARQWRTLAGVALFVAGFTAVFVAFGVLAGSLGAAVVQWSDVITRVLGVVVIAMGLVFVGWIPFAQRQARLRIAPVAGLWGAPVLGVVFGLGWTPCIGPTLVAVYTLALDGGSAGRGAALSVAYCIGLGLPFLLLAAGLDRSARALGFLRTHRLVIMRTGGVLLVLVGLALVTGAWAAFTSSLQGLIGGFETVV